MKKNLRSCSSCKKPFKGKDTQNNLCEKCLATEVVKYWLKGDKIKAVQTMCIYLFLPLSLLQIEQRHYVSLMNLINAIVFKYLRGRKYQRLGPPYYYLKNSKTDLKGG